MDNKISAIFEGYPVATRDNLLELRRLIRETAAETEGVGELEETLRWGQASYLTTASGSGTMLRIDRVKTARPITRCTFTAKRRWLIRIRGCSAIPSNTKGPAPFYLITMTNCQWMR